MCLAPVLAASLAAWVLGTLIFDTVASLWQQAFCSFVLLLLIFVIWTPVILAAYDLNRWVKHFILILRSIFLIIFFAWISKQLMEGLRIFIDSHILYAFSFLLASGVIFTYLRSAKLAFSDPLFRFKPADRPRKPRWVAYDVIDNFAQLMFLLAAVMGMLCYFTVKDPLTMPSKALFDGLEHETKMLIGQVDTTDLTLIRLTNDSIDVDDELHKLQDRQLMMISNKTNLQDTALASLKIVSSKDSTMIMRDIETKLLDKTIQRREIQQRIETRQREIRKNAIRSVRLLWICASLLIVLLLMLWSVVPYHLIRTVLLNPAFHDTLARLRYTIMRSGSYTWQYIRALLNSHPIIFGGGVVLTIILLASPLILKSALRIDLLAGLIEPDIILFGLGLFIAWFSPMVLAANHADETFGEYFNQRLADSIITIQNHTIIVGYGNLGKRVTDRELQLLRESRVMSNLQNKKDLGKHFFNILKPIKRFVSRKWLQWQNWRERRKYFFKIVTPDLRIEEICNAVLIIEPNDKDFLFSADNDLLGNFGVVGVGKGTSEDPDEASYFSARILVPILQGHAEQPFILSRVNLQRAHLLISTIQEESNVQTIFNAVDEANPWAIICVARSDQIGYLTYLASRKKITLLYPTFNQGVELAQRLWAAILKIREIKLKKMSGEEWPKVLVVGNSKAKHYMLESLWTNLPPDRKSILERCMAFLVIDHAQMSGYPILRRKEEREAFDREWTNTYVTSSRYSQPGREQDDVLHIETCIINQAETYALEQCLKDYKPDILLINDDDVETSLLMLLRFVRTLERMGFRKKFHDRQEVELPLILLAATRGDEGEKRNLGDATHFYDAMSKIYKKNIEQIEETFPRHAVFDYGKRLLRGESITDSLGDTAEMMAGIRESIYYSQQQNDNSGQQKKSERFIEINACLPNVPGALLAYIARLAGLTVELQNQDTQKSETTPTVSKQEEPATQIPSFQYLRNIRLDPSGERFAITGYATLARSKKISHNDALARRIFANDGTSHREDGERNPQKLYRPGIIEAIDMVMGSSAREPTSIEDFYNVLFNPQPNKLVGEHNCPGMTTCPIANYQDFIVASNDIRLNKFIVGASIPKEKNIKYAENYYCSIETNEADDKDIPDSQSSYARIFCCAQDAKKIGTLARTLNCLLLRESLKNDTARGNDTIAKGEEKKAKLDSAENEKTQPQAESTQDEKKSSKENEAQGEKWQVNIQYFNQISCQNARFNLNRLFGYFKPYKKIDDEELEDIPINFIRILPIGSDNAFREWYEYACKLYQRLGGDKNFMFDYEWVNKYSEHLSFQEERRKDKEKRDYKEILPVSFDKLRGSPVSITINRKPKVPESEREAGKCEYCQKQEEYDCRSLRI